MHAREPDVIEEGEEDIATRGGLHAWDVLRQPRVWPNARRTPNAARAPFDEAPSAPQERVAFIEQARGQANSAGHVVVEEERRVETGAAAGSDRSIRRGAVPRGRAGPP